jgi:hypothetical protein
MAHIQPRDEQRASVACVFLILVAISFAGNDVLGGIFEQGSPAGALS